MDSEWSDKTMPRCGSIGSNEDSVANPSAVITSTILSFSIKVIDIFMFSERPFSNLIGVVLTFSSTSSSGINYQTELGNCTGFSKLRNFLTSLRKEQNQSVRKAIHRKSQIKTQQFRLWRHDDHVELRKRLSLSRRPQQSSPAFFNQCDNTESKKTKNN